MKGIRQVLFFDNFPIFGIGLKEMRDKCCNSLDCLPILFRHLNRYVFVGSFRAFEQFSHIAIQRSNFDEYCSDLRVWFDVC